MPLFLTWQYFASLIFALLVTFGTKRAGVRSGLTFVALLSIILCLWFLGRHPLGFLVSVGGWLVFLLTVLLAKVLALMAVTMDTPKTME
jgi:hypothetical protein